MPRILLLGRDTKITIPLTHHLLNRAIPRRGTPYHVIGLIRSPSQRKPLHPDRHELLRHSLKGVTGDEAARAILSKVRAEWVVWVSGKAGDVHSPTHKLTNPSTLLARGESHTESSDICERFIRASVSLPRVNTFLLISSIYSRRRQAPWWNTSVLNGVEGLLHNEHATKLTVDECLTAAARIRGSKFRAMVLRPGELTNANGGGVCLGTTKSIGRVSRNDVARVAAYWLDLASTSAWLDLLEGGEKVDYAVRTACNKGVDCIRGENVEAMMQKYDQSLPRGPRGEQKIQKPNTLLEYETWMRSIERDDE